MIPCEAINKTATPINKIPTSFRNEVKSVSINLPVAGESASTS